MALAQKATINWTAYWDDVMEYLEEEAPKNWREIFRKLIRGVVIDHAEQWSATLGLTWSAQNLFARDWYNNYILKFAQAIIETTKQDISAVLSFGMREGWGIPQIQDSLETLFQQYISGDANLNTWFTDRLPRYRTEMIARTETIRASNAGTTASYQEWGVAQHEWLSTQDDRTRTRDPDAKNPSDFEHLANWPDGPNGEVVDIGQPFKGTGESLMFPGDLEGSPGNTINCRCTTIPVIPGVE